MPYYCAHHTLAYSKDSVSVFVRRHKLVSGRDEATVDDVVCDLCLDLISKMDAAAFQMEDAWKGLRVRAGKKGTGTFRLSQTVSFRTFVCLTYYGG
jgi:hypothetical protein